MYVPWDLLISFFVKGFKEIWSDATEEGWVRGVRIHLSIYSSIFLRLTSDGKWVCCCFDIYAIHS